MHRHPPECFENGRHKFIGTDRCPEQDETKHPLLGWIKDPFEDCNLSDADWFCYNHQSYDCGRLQLIWWREIGMITEDGIYRSLPTDRDALLTLLVCCTERRQLDMILTALNYPVLRDRVQP